MSEIKEGTLKFCLTQEQTDRFIHWRKEELNFFPEGKHSVFTFQFTPEQNKVQVINEATKHVLVL